MGGSQDKVDICEGGTRLILCGPRSQRRTRGWKLQAFWVSTSQMFLTTGTGQHRIRRHPGVERILVTGDIQTGAALARRPSLYAR